MRHALARFSADSRGSTAVEYSLIAAGIALAMLTALLPYSTVLQGIFASIQAGIASLTAL